MKASRGSYSAKFAVKFAVQSLYCIWSIGALQREMSRCMCGRSMD